MATPPLRVVGGAGRGIRYEVVVRQTTLDDLLDEVTALSQEASELVDHAMPLALQLRLMAMALGPTSGRIADDLVRLLERHERRHTPGKAA